MLSRINLFKDIQARQQLKTSSESLEKLLVGKKTTFYLGVDPTAPSLHLGHLAPFVFGLRLLSLGHRMILLLGGATAQIGDPTGTRTQIPQNIIQQNSSNLTKNIVSLMKNQSSNQFLIVNNMKWYENMRLLTFLQSTSVPIKPMLKRDSVREGQTFPEFTYQLLQGMDFVQLFKKYGCLVQIGGSDQWGNMVAGLDLMAKMKKQAYILTVPLVCFSGKKMSKSGQNVCWLDSNLTSVYEMYQFLCSVKDDQVHDLLRQLTFLPLQEIENLQKIEAQVRLADEVCALVHGVELQQKAKRQSILLHSNYSNLNTDFLKDFEGDERLISTQYSSIMEAFVRNSLCTKTMFFKMLKRGAIHVNNSKIEDGMQQIEYLKDKFAILKISKKFIILIK